MSDLISREALVVALKAALRDGRDWGQWNSAVQDCISVVFALPAAPLPAATDEMVERAARYIYETEPTIKGLTLYDALITDKQRVYYWRNRARAILTAAIGEGKP